jgi:DNA-binding beta-propeller fold protein YncE
VLNVDKNYEFVERIPLPFPREGTQGDCKGIDASVQTGMIYPMLIDRAVAIDLETSTMMWQKVYDGGCCDRGVMSPYGETLWQAGNGFNAWYVTSAINGELIETITDWPGRRAHNTIISPRGDQILLSPDNNVLYLYDTRTHELIREIGPMTGRNRPYSVNGKWTRVYSSNNGVLGFQVSDIQTGNVLYRVDAPGPQPCRTSSGAHGTCQHGIALTHDETAVWIPSASDNTLMVFDMTGSEPKFFAQIQDYGPSGWITCSIDGHRMYPASGTVYNARTLQEITRLVDDRGRYVYSEKLMEVRFKNGKAVEVGDQWCNGQVGAEEYALSPNAPVIGRRDPSYQPNNVSGGKSARKK